MKVTWLENQSNRIILASIYSASFNAAKLEIFTVSPSEARFELVSTALRSERPTMAIGHLVIQQSWLIINYLINLAFAKLWSLTHFNRNSYRLDVSILLLKYYYIIITVVKLEEEILICSLRKYETEPVVNDRVEMKINETLENSSYVINCKYRSSHDLFIQWLIYDVMTFLLIEGTVSTVMG